MHALIDWMAVKWQGGVRVRILRGGADPVAKWVGGMKGLSGERALQAILELKPEGPGTVHIKGGLPGYYRVTVSGELGDGFAQRVRNLLALQ